MHSGEVREILRGKGPLQRPLGLQPACSWDISTLASERQLNFLWWLVKYFAFLKTSRHWSIANELTWKTAHSVETAHSVLTLTTGTTGLKWQSCCYFLPHLHCLQEAVDANRTVHKLQRNTWIVPAPLAVVGVFSVYSYHIFSPVLWSNEQGLSAANPHKSTQMWTHSHSWACFNAAWSFSWTPSNEVC